mmetsp:Transcript_53422/g.98798  ORF Transcript_53422/g.98798 Transcript_53422/m.98798 type:complete len:219 (+) Transcript_53422:40-696(+)
MMADCRLHWSAVLRSAIAVSLCSSCCQVVRGVDVATSQPQVAAIVDATGEVASHWFRRERIAQQDTLGVDEPASLEQTDQVLEKVLQHARSELAPGIVASLSQFQHDAPHEPQALEMPQQLSQQRISIGRALPAAVSEEDLEAKLEHEAEEHKINVHPGAYIFLVFFLTVCAALAGVASQARQDGLKDIFLEADFGSCAGVRSSKVRRPVEQVAQKAS